MKILMINGVCGIRSTGRICTDLAAALEAKGYEVKIAYGRETVPERFQKYAVRIGSDLDVKVHGLRARLWDDAGWGSKRATLKFIEWVRQYDPDVIHLHNIHGYYINIEVLFRYLRTCGKKILWTLHDCWAFTGHAAYCEAAGCERWKHGCHDCPNRGEYPKSLTDNSRRNWEKKKRMLDRIPNMTIVTPSEWLAGLVRSSFLGQYEVKVIHNGVDTSRFFPMENDFKAFYGIEDRTMVLGLPTSWDDGKGYAEYLKLAALLGDGYRMVLTGLTREQTKALPPNVLGLEGTSSGKELAQISSAADVFVDLSDCRAETKLRLHGKPVIAYASDGCSESAGEKRILVPKGETEAVIREVERIAPSSGGDRRADRPLPSRQGQSGGGYWSYKQTLGLTGKGVMIAVAAVWDKRKGLDDVIALSRLVDGQVMVVGVSEEQKKLLPSTIRTVTKTADVEELRRLYAISDVLINPTYEDNYPTVNIEAIACGTPVVTYETGGSPESARHYGIVAAQGNVRQLAAAVSELGDLCRDASFLENDRFVRAYVELLTE